MTGSHWVFYLRNFGANCLVIRVIFVKKSEMLRKNGVQLITSLRSNMKNKLLPYIDKLLLRKRFLIETINDLLKNQLQIEHTRHRSPKNFLANLISGLVAYTFRPNKPRLNIDRSCLQMIIA